MMVTTALACFVLIQDPIFGKFHSRQEFCDAMKKIDRNDENEWTKAKVRNLLGQPDDIWISTDPKKYINMSGGEVWCYGTNGHHTLPTLGSVTFMGDTVLFRNFSSRPPSTNLISEEELRSALRRIHRFQDYNQFEDGNGHTIGDPLHRIRATNVLIPLGKEKAVAVMQEYSHVVPMWSEDREFLFWMTRLVFRGKKAGYAFPVPGLGAMSPRPPTEPSKWPTYPVINVADFPFLIYHGADLNGVPEFVGQYLMSHQADWEIVDNKLVPPNDPFPLFYEAIKIKGSELDDPRALGEHATNRLHGAVASNIFRAVRNVIKFKKNTYGISPEEFEVCHQKFLKLKPFWDNRLGLYIRGDGTYDKDATDEYPQTTIKFPDMNNLKVEVTVSRTGELGVDVSANCHEMGSELIKSAILEVVDADAERMVGTFLINTFPNHRESKDEMLELAPHKASGSISFASGFNLPLGHKAKLILTYDGKSYESKIWVP